MKKLLIASSAIVGVSMLATSAHAANVTAGGSYSFEVQMGGADNASDAMTFSGGTYDFSVSAEKTTDSGLTLTGATHLDSAGAGGAAVWDESAGAIAGDFGTISFSNDGGGVSSMAPGANGLSASGDVDDFIKIDGTSATAGDRGVGATGNTFSYTSPNISGFKAGITLGRNGGNSEIDYSKEDGAPANGFALFEEDANGDLLYPNANTEYTGIAFSYSVAGATIGFAQGSETTSIDVKGLVDDADTADTDESASNGKHESTSSGTKLSIRYATGPLTVGLSQTTVGEAEFTYAGTKEPASTGGNLANAEVNEMVIGISYNYGAGTVSYVTASEDWSKDGDPTAAETLTTNLLAVSHSVGDGLSVYFENHAGSTVLDNEDGYDSVSENVIGLKLTF